MRFLRRLTYRSISRPSQLKEIVLSVRYVWEQKKLNAEIQDRKNLPIFDISAFKLCRLRWVENLPGYEISTF